MKDESRADLAVALAWQSARRARGEWQFAKRMFERQAFFRVMIGGLVFAFDYRRGGIHSICDPEQGGFIQTQGKI